MDRDTHENKGSLSQAGKGENFGEISVKSDDGVVLEAVIVINSEETASSSGGSQILNASPIGLGSTNEVKKQECRDGGGIDESANGQVTGNSTGSVDGIVPESKIMVSLGISGLKKDLPPNTDELGSSGGINRQDIHGGRAHSEALNQGEQGNGAVCETVIAIGSVENADPSGHNGRLVKGNESGSVKVAVDKSKPKSPKLGKPLCVTEMRFGSASGRGALKDNCAGENVCRICHLGSEGLIEAAAASPSPAATATSMDLIQLGCGCKDELSIAHVHCAEAWFKLKGNRMCEICGMMAKNIAGIGDNRFTEDWNQRRFMGNGAGPSDRGGGCWRGKPFCNFLLVCLAIAFVLPWFFRAKMF